MMEKLNLFMLKAYLGGKAKVEEFKNDERGLSGVVVAVLLILVAVLAVTIIWGALSGWLDELWEKIINAGNEITT